MVAGAADVARRRRERGLLLNHPEAVAVLTAWVLEAARDGMSVAEIMSAGCDVLDTSDVMEGVEVLIDELQAEATFPDGTKLVTLHGPIQPAPLAPGAADDGAARLVPGEVLLGEGDIVLLEGRELISLTVLNTGDRPVQVGSHFHFAEANEALQFDREAAVGRRLAVPAGTSVRFEPGISMDGRARRLRRRAASPPGSGGSTRAARRERPDPVPGEVRRALRPHRPATASAWPTPTC